MKSDTGRQCYFYDKHSTIFILLKKYSMIKIKVYLMCGEYFSNKQTRQVHN